ncbi:DUF397 domain-containing protein [Kitasatospora sp. NPDC056138]|uniref:DUF397 domain-containing protein n=1 Tax=Kitasatospora sp. NPDC056138 TaxID=3345724 RepID=UPI0035E12207
MNIEQSAQGTAESMWRKSSYSGGEGGECVEVALTPDAVHVRDSKDQSGPRLTFTPRTWAAFVQFAAGI